MVKNLDSMVHQLPLNYPWLLHQRIPDRDYETITNVGMLQPVVPFCVRNPDSKLHNITQKNVPITHAIMEEKFSKYAEITQKFSNYAAITQFKSYCEQSYAYFEILKY